MIKRIFKLIQKQLDWLRSQRAFGKQRRAQERRATNLAVALTCTGALRRHA